MDPELYQRACDIFAQACDTPASDRAAYVDQACSGNRALHELVSDLLANDQSLTSRGPFDSFAIDLDEPKPGDHIRNYVIERLLGEGGMGLVYLAEQLEPVRRKVALKIIRAGLDTKMLLTRFAREGQLLAMMEHPNIARVFDAGATEAHRPFFAMEYVDGMPITAWCEQNRLSIPQRLELFVSVCLAVHHAHQKGVIHRDLKPSNILVTTIDGAPIAKVIDFGIGKAMTDTDIGETLRTRPGVMLGTPEYLSPEQALATSQLDPRTDIYSLGIVLYELLVGCRPMERALTSADDARDRARSHVDPKRPSTRLRDLGSEANTVAEQRSIRPAQLESLLKSDLDWIVLHAIERDRERRYSSAAAFADDITRYLTGRAVEARPPSITYRASKFARRHRAAVVGSAAILTALILGAVASRLVTHRATPAVSANAVQVHTSSPSALQHYTLGVSAIQEKDFDSMRGQFRDAVGYDSTFAMAYYQWSRAESFWGLSPEVRELAQQAERFRQSETTVNQFLIHSWYLYTSNQLAQLDSVLASTPKTVRSDPEFLMHVARLYWYDMQTPERALPLLVELTRIAPHNAEAFNMLAYCQTVLTHYDEALRAARTYLALEPNGPNAYDTMGDVIGNIYPDSCAYYWREAVRRKSDFVVSIEKLGYFALWQGRFDEARYWFGLLISRSDPAEYFYRIRASRTLAVTSLCQGRFDEALSILQDGVRAEGGVGALVNNERALMYTTRALILEDLGRYSEALVDADSALARTAPFYQLQIPECLPAKVRILLELGRVDEAEELVRNAGADTTGGWRHAVLVAAATLDRADGSYGPAIQRLKGVTDHFPIECSPRIELANCYLDAGMPDKAAATYAEAFANATKGLRSNPVSLLHGALRCAQSSLSLDPNVSPCTISQRFMDYWVARDRLLGSADLAGLHHMCGPSKAPDASD